MRQVYNITVDFVNENFYNIGEVIYRKDGRKCSNYTSNKNYYLVWFKDKEYSVHRILWILYNQESIPDGLVIDHIDGNRKNNTKENLRLATYSQNSQNSKNRKNNSTGYKGISIKKDRGYFYYYCQICRNYKSFFKQFPLTPSGLELAKTWLEFMRKELHGEFSKI